MKASSYNNAGFLNAESSSIFRRQTSPAYAIDRKVSMERHNHFFHSSKEDYPWLQLTMSEGYISGVWVIPRVGWQDIYGWRNCCANRLRNMELNAGLTPVPAGFTGSLTVNTKGKCQKHPEEVINPLAPR